MKTKPKKYKLLKTDKVFPSGKPQKQLRALIDIPEIGVTAGDLGGFIEKESNLSHEGNCWIFKDAQAYGSAKFTETAVARGGVFRGGEFLGGAFHGGAFHGGEFHGGEWAFPPIQIKGSRHFANASSYNTIQIGCKNFKIAQWEKNVRKIAKLEGYTDSEIDEYEQIVQFIKNWLILKGLYEQPE